MVLPNNITFTIVTENYLCFAKALKNSFKKHNPEARFENHISSDKDIISTSVLEPSQYNDMRARYDNMALVCALKPYFTDYFLAKEGIENVVYLDADIYVYNSFRDNIFKLLEDSSEKTSIILSPHVISKLGTDNMVRNINYLTFGTYNAGFFAVKNNSHGKEFIKWWKDIMFLYCKNDLKYGFFYDQTWLNLVPNYFYNFYTLIVHPGCNVAYWNIDERSITKKGDTYYCHENLLIFYHFARFNYFDPQITKNIDEINPLMKEIYADYKAKLKELGIERSITKPVAPSKENTIISKIKRFFQ